MPSFKKLPCRMCFNQITTLSTCQIHPLLKIPICNTCFEFYSEGDWELGEDGTSDYCNFCADGGNLLPCDNLVSKKDLNKSKGSKATDDEDEKDAENEKEKETDDESKKPCPYSFCFDCLEKSMSDEAFQKLKQDLECEDETVEETKWFCLCCQPTNKIKFWQHDADRIIELKEEEAHEADTADDENEATSEPESVPDSEVSSLDSEVERMKAMKLARTQSDNPPKPTEDSEKGEDESEKPVESDHESITLQNGHATPEKKKKRKRSRQETTSDQEVESVSKKTKVEETELLEFSKNILDQLENLAEILSASESDDGSSQPKIAKLKHDEERQTEKSSTEPVSDNLQNGHLSDAEKEKNPETGHDSDHSSNLSIIQIEDDSVPDENDQFMKNLENLDPKYKDWILNQINFNKKLQTKNEKINKFIERRKTLKQEMDAKVSAAKNISKSSTISDTLEQMRKLKEQNKKYKTGLKKIKENISKQPTTEKIQEFEKKFSPKKLRERKPETSEKLKELAENEVSKPRKSATQKKERKDKKKTSKDSQGDLNLDSEASAESRSEEENVEDLEKMVNQKVSSSEESEIQPSPKRKGRNLVQSSKRNSEPEAQEDLQFSDDSDDSVVVRKSRRLRNSDAKKDEKVSKIKENRKKNLEKIDEDTDDPIFSDNQKEDPSSEYMSSEGSGDEASKKVSNRLKQLNRRYQSSDTHSDASEKDKKSTRRKKSVEKSKKPIQFSSDEDAISIKSDIETKKKSLSRSQRAKARQEKKTKAINLDSTKEDSDQGSEAGEDKEALKSGSKSTSKKSSREQSPLNILSDNSENSENYQAPTPTSSLNNSDKENENPEKSKKKMHPFFKNNKTNKTNTDDTIDLDSTLKSQSSGAGDLPKFRQRAKKGEGKKGKDKGPRKERKKRERKILDREALKESTKQALKEEEERRERLINLQTKALENMDEESSDEELDKHGNKIKKVYIDTESKVRIEPALANLLKKHQIAAARFVFDNFYESVGQVKKQLKYYDEQEKKNDEAFDRHGKGCILAHCMGLGKTFSTIATLHTIMNHELLSSEMVGKTTLVMCPKNVFQNWQDEVTKWCKKCPKETRIPVFMFPQGSRDRDKLKVEELKKWRRRGGIMIMTYDQFKNHVMLAHEKEIVPDNVNVDTTDRYRNRKKKKKKSTKKPKKIQKSLRKDFITGLLDPGPDIVVLDEAHIIRNQESDINTTVNLISTQRRLALTGTPMQNNLVEYYWMCNFCKPNLLGTVVEFKNQYAITIQRGQSKDATDRELQEMKKYAALLYTILKDTVHRQDESTLQKMLPEKIEYLIGMRLTPVQEKLYARFMEIRGFGSNFLTRSDNQLKLMDNDMMQALRSNMKQGLFSDKLKLETLCFHPGLLQKQIEEQADEETDSMDEFIDDGKATDDEASDADSEKSWNSTQSKESKNSKVSKADSKASSNTTDSMHLLDKNLEELESYCKTRLPLFKKQGDMKKIMDFAAVDEVFNGILERQELSTTRRLAYGFFLTAAGDIEHPTVFECCYKNEAVAINNEQIENLRNQKTTQMRNLLLTHFHKELQKELRRPPRPEEINAKLDSPEVQAHAKNQIETQLKSEINKLKKGVLRDKANHISSTIEARIREDASAKAKKDAAKWFRDEEIGYHYDPDQINYTLGSKLNFALTLVHNCERNGEKVVLASQRMDVLDQIELCLRQITLETKDKRKKKDKAASGVIADSDEENPADRNESYLPEYKHVGKWYKDVDYFRIDGQVSVEKRMDAVHKFNKKESKRARLMLLSTRAGGIGINLVGASRMILIDVSFNPAIDRQALFRIYRLGQTRTCRIYRLVADGTMEHAIFKRQIDKIHLSHRVVDEKHCERQFNEKDLKELYRYKPELKYVSSTLVEDAPGKTYDELVPPTTDDMLMKMFMDETLQPYIATWQLTESLLVEDDAMTKLTEEEKKAIWEIHKQELLSGKAPKTQTYVDQTSHVSDMPMISQSQLNISPHHQMLLETYNLVDRYQAMDPANQFRLLQQLENIMRHNNRGKT